MEKNSLRREKCERELGTVVNPYKKTSPAGKEVAEPVDDLKGPTRIKVPPLLKNNILRNT